MSEDYLACPLCDVIFYDRRETEVEQQHVAVQKEFQLHLEQDHNAINGYDILFKLLQLNTKGTKRILDFLDKLIEELERKGEVGLWICQDCGASFSSDRSLYGHRREKHSRLPQVFPCPECGKEFSRKFNLKAHINTLHAKASDDLLENAQNYQETSLKLESSVKLEVAAEEDLEYTNLLTETDVAMDPIGSIDSRSGELTLDPIEPNDVRLSEILVDPSILQSPLATAPPLRRILPRPVHADKLIDEERNGDEGLLICLDCGGQFTSKRSLYGHQREKHSSLNRVFPCPNCGKEFSRKFNLKAHRKSVHGTVSSEIIGNAHISQETSDNGESNMTNIVKEDEYVNFLTKTDTAINPIQPIDIISGLNSEYEDLKEEDNSEKAKYDTPIDEEEWSVDASQLICPDCGSYFTSKRSLYGHRREKHGKLSRAFPCPECGKDFSRKYNLKAHRKTVHGVTSNDGDQETSAKMGLNVKIEAEEDLEYINFLSGTDVGMDPLENKDRNGEEDSSLLRNGNDTNSIELKNESFDNCIRPSVEERGSYRSDEREIKNQNQASHYKRIRHTPEQRQFCVETYREIQSENRNNRRDHFVFLYLQKYPNSTCVPLYSKVRRWYEQKYNEHGNVCELCGFEGENQAVMNNHMSRKHNDRLPRPHVCRYRCGYASVSDKTLRKHERFCHLRGARVT